MNYEEPMMEILNSNIQDVITASGELEPDDNYTGEGGFAPRT